MVSANFLESVHSEVIIKFGQYLILTGGLGQGYGVFLSDSRSTVAAAAAASSCTTVFVYVLCNF